MNKVSMVHRYTYIHVSYFLISAPWVLTKLSPLCAFRKVTSSLLVLQKPTS